MMMDRSPHEDLLAPVAFTPGVRGNDPLARYWLGQASLRLRRELCWLWRERASLRWGLAQWVGRALAAGKPSVVMHSFDALDLNGSPGRQVGGAGHGNRLETIVHVTSFTSHRS